MNVGIIALQVYFPNTYVCQTKLEKYDHTSPGKYTKGLGQLNMAVTNNREDAISMALSVTDRLLTDYNINPNDIGRIEVGSESNIDKSKSIKSHLMDLFTSHGNYNIEGVDNVNACYGGTAAVFNSLAWLQSDDCNNKYALVVTTDIAIYENGPARPTGGCGAVAILLGRNASIIVEPGLRSSYMTNSYDFYKPIMDVEYPIVNGKESSLLYLQSLENCYHQYKKNYLQKYKKNFKISEMDYCIFHSPFSKLVYKSISKLYNLDKLQVNTSQVEDGLYYNKYIGNSYTSSLWFSLCSLIKTKQLPINTKILAFSYGSGSASTIFSLRVINKLTNVKECLLDLSKRIEISPKQYMDFLHQREELYNTKNKILTSNLLPLQENAYYIHSIDTYYRRKYIRKKTPIININDMITHALTHSNL